MKSFSRFLFEAEGSQAVMQAKRLGLSGDGHGGWYKDGEFVAKTVSGKLKFYNQRQAAGAKDPNQVRTAANQEVAATQVQQPEQPQQPEEKKEDRGVLTIAFGRFNPPTIGHEKLLDKVANVAGKGEYKIFPSRSNDKKKNPLDPDTKISVMRQMYPKHGERIVNDANSKTIFDVLKQAHADGYSGVNIVVGSDRQAEFEKLANQYNGQLYDFKDINVVSAGERDPDAEGVEGMSASKLRKAAAEGDFKAFRSGVPKTLDDKSAKQLFNTIRKSMGVNEGWILWEIAPKFDWKNLRENYIHNKIFKVGQLVENLNTGLVGRIIRRGTNYLICVTESDMMFKSWIKDVVEYTEVKSDSPMRDKKHPNTLVGSLGAFKNYAKMTPGAVGSGSENLQKGAKAYGVNFINKYKAKSS